MTKTVHAIYEDGTFKPLEEVDLADHQKVTLTVITSEKNGLSLKKVLQYLKKGPFPTRTPDEITQDFEIDVD